MDASQSYWRYESRQSEILSISRWLRSVDQTQVITFLNQLKTELEFTSIGEMTAAFVLKNQSMLSNQSIKNLINSINSVSFTSNSLSDNQNTIKHVYDTPVTESSQNQLTIANASKNRLLLLSNDTFDCLGQYLSTHDASSLGRCSYMLYRMTQRRSFLVKVGKKLLVLARQHIQRIHDFKIDMWQSVLGCRDLYLIEKPCTISDNGLSNLLDAIEIMPNYTNWIEILFQNVNHIHLSHDCTLFLQLIPIKTLFSIEQYNKNTNQIEHVDRHPLTFSFGNLEHSLSDFAQFVAIYNEFFVNDCQNNLEHIRRIKCLKFESHYHSETSFQQISRLLHHLKPNYNEIEVMHDVKFESVNNIFHLFHPNMTTFRAQSIDILLADSEILGELHFRALENGLTFSLQQLITQHDETATESTVTLTEDQLNYIHHPFDANDGYSLDSEIRSRDRLLNIDLRGDSQMTWLVSAMSSVVIAGDNHHKINLSSIYGTLLTKWVKYLLNTDQISCKELESLSGHCNVKKLEIIQTNYFPHGIETHELDKFCYLFKSPFAGNILNFSQSLEFLHFSFLSPIFKEVDQNKLRDENKSDNESHGSVNILPELESRINQWKTAFDNVMCQTLLKEVQNITECQINIQLDTHNAFMQLKLDDNVNENRSSDYTLDNYVYTTNQWFIMIQRHLLQWALSLHKKTESKKHGMKLMFMITYGNRDEQLPMNIERYLIDKNAIKEGDYKLHATLNSDPLGKGKSGWDDCVIQLQNMKQRMLLCLNDSNILKYCFTSEYFTVQFDY